MRIEQTLKPFQITANLQATGSGQSDAAAIPTDCCIVTSSSSPSIGGGVILPNDAQAGEVFVVACAYNPSNGAWANIYPPIGGNFVGSSVNSGMQFPYGSAFLFISFGSGVFLAMPFSNFSY